MGFKQYDVLPVLDESTKENLWDKAPYLKTHAEFLTKDLVANRDSIVMNVDAKWGTGKTFFLRHWERQLVLEGYPVVYFNAWENDCAEDPILPLALRVVRGFKKSPTTKLKEYAVVLATDFPKLLANALAEQVAGSKTVAIAEKLLSKMGACADAVDQKMDARDRFKEEINKLAESSGEKSLFVFIDELDRCRPSFAIETLERIKHLFDVPGIKFVFATDTDQLCESIKGAYGQGFDARRYLERFFNYTFRLPQSYDERWIRPACAGGAHSDYTYEFARFFGLSTRQTLQFANQMRVSSKLRKHAGELWAYEIYCFLLGLRIHSADLYAKVRNGSILWEEFNSQRPLSGIANIPAVEYLLSHLQQEELRSKNTIFLCQKYASIDTASLQLVTQEIKRIVADAECAISLAQHIS